MKYSHFNLTPKKPNSMSKINNIIESINNLINTSLENERESQIQEMIDNNVGIFRPNGTIKHDLGKLDMVYAVITDGIIKDLNSMEMREEITEDELDLILHEADLN